MTGQAALAVLRAERHVSVSAINAYLACPRQFEHRYVLHTEPSHRSGALAFGSAIHTALATFYRGLMEHGLAPSCDELTSIFADAWERELDGAVPVLLEDEGTPSKDLGVQLVQVFHASAPRPAKVLGVEEPFSVEIVDPTNGVVFAERLVGVFDAVVQDPDGGCRILEHKTAGRRYAQSRLDHDLQVTAYSLAAPMVGLDRATVTLQLLLKQKSPTFEVHHLTRTDRDRQDLRHVLSGVLLAVQVGAFYPVRDWHCSGCPYAGPCLAG